MLSRAVSRFATISTRRYAAAAAAKTSGAEELRLTLASPDQVCSNQFQFLISSQAIYNASVVKQVDVPTLAGVVGVLANHVPTIGVLKPGVVQVTEADGQHFSSFKYCFTHTTLQVFMKTICFSHQSIQVYFQVTLPNTLFLRVLSL